MEGGGKCVFASFFGGPEDREFGEKNTFCTSNKLLLIAGLIMTTGSKIAFKVGSVKFANSLSPPSIVKKVRTGSKSSHRTATPGKSQGS